ncbi:MAG TPA: acyl-CoA dehydrogenase family protein, partial [Actinomycetota bacterium]|nr:acyl-CoA dehydrogenase family protein [Actinomycetota bacterium]
SEAVGVASQAVDLTVAHARDREQFGRAIGSFQAVSHQIADAYMDAENARSLSMWAAASIDGGEADARLAAETAAAFSTTAAIRACERAIQVHGGIGFTWEHVLHRYYKRAQWISAYLDGSQMWQAVADSVIDGASYNA